MYYLDYRATMQHRVMHLMSKKMAEALALEDEFSEDRLAAMAGDDNMQMALAKGNSNRWLLSPRLGRSGASFTEGSARTATPFEALAPHFA